MFIFVADSHGVLVFCLPGVVLSCCGCCKPVILTFWCAGCNVFFVVFKKQNKKKKTFQYVRVPCVCVGQNPAIPHRGARW